MLINERKYYDRWTEIETKYLLDNLYKHTLRYLGKQLKRSERAIKAKLKLLRVNKYPKIDIPNIYWNGYDEEYIIYVYYDYKVCKVGSYKDLGDAEDALFRWKILHMDIKTTD